MTNESVNKTSLIETNKDSTTEPKTKNKAELLGKGLYFTIISSIGILSGFGYSLGATKKQNPKLNKNVKNINYLHYSGVKLARKALFRATIITVSGFSIFCFSIWKLSGAENFQDFRYKIGNFLPRLSNKNKENEGRRDFKNLTELWEHLIDEDQKKKK